MTDIQYGSTIIGGREVSRPYGVGFSPKASGFYPFTDATDLVIGRRWCCGVADSSLSLEPQTKGTVLSVCYKERVDTILRIDTGGTETKNIKNSLLACQKDKNHSPFHDEKPGRDVILHVRP